MNQEKESPEKNMYYFAVGAMFKNESKILKEWIEHYLFHGAEHFYLIDDASTDDFLPILQPYIDKHLVSLFQHPTPWTYYLGRQSDMYNYYIFPRLKETKWLAIVDLDEYLWSPVSIDLKYPLWQSENLGQIQIQGMYFGSNGHIQQPDSIVKSFTRRDSAIDGGLKYIVNSSYSFNMLGIHHAVFTDEMDAKKKFCVLSPQYFRLNHYSCQSREYWNNVKCTRGDGDDYRVRTPADFDLVDLNEIEDMNLYEQNKPMFSKDKEETDEIELE